MQHRYGQRAVSDVFLTDFRLVIMCASTPPPVPPTPATTTATTTTTTTTTTTDTAAHQGAGSAATSPAAPASPTRPPTAGADVVGDAVGDVGAGGGERIKLDTDMDLSTYVPLGTLMDVTLQVQACTRHFVKKGGNIFRGGYFA